MAKRDYYDVLGVARNAAADEIKSAYRRQARKYHPDVSKAADATDRFREATEAYEVLCDPQKRQAYDRFGHAEPRPGVGPQAGPMGAGFSMDFEDVLRAARAGGGGSDFLGMSLADILSALGGAGFGGRKSRRKSSPKAPWARAAGEDLQHELTISFLQGIRGTTATVRIHSDDGSGGRTTETLEVKIPAGVREGAKIRVRGKGKEGGGGPGDLYIIVHVREHPYFRREGDDIYVEVPVSITEAALGAKVDVPTLDGMSTVTIPPGTSSSQRLRLRGEGVKGPGKTEPGDQYVVIRIVSPKKLSPQGAELLRKLQDTDPYDPRGAVPWRE